MKIGLIDVDAESRGKVTFPNLSLMKLSAWHKAQGDSVEWYNAFTSGECDVVYMAKVFGSEYTGDYQFPVYAKKIVKGGSGYAISIVDGREVYDKSKDAPLPYEIEHIMPDYDLYGITDTAYGFLTRGCPRACEFCHVSTMQGRASKTVATINEFWSGQKNIVLLDPNITASKDCISHFRDLAQTKAYVDFSQGLDIRLMTAEKIEALNDVKWKRLHFAWDNPEDDVRKQFEQVASKLKKFRRDLISAYVLTNFNSTHEQDLQRIMFLREIGVQPYVMIYRKETAPPETRRLQRWCSPFIFWKCPSFDEYNA